MNKQTRLAPAAAPIVPATKARLTDLSGTEMEAVTARFWTITQNNSGGIFDHDAKAGIGYGLCVEAISADEADGRMREIYSSYAASYDCPCCGDRWSTYLYGDGDEEPTLYGKPLTGGWGLPSYVHYLDGRVEARTDQDADA